MTATTAGTPASTPSTTESDILIDVSDLSAEYPARGPSDPVAALKGVSFQLNRGEVLGVLGETGSGKSALLRILAGVAEEKHSGGPDITGGEARVLGHALRGLNRRGRAQLTFHVGYLAQDAAATLSPDRTVTEVVAAPIYARDADYSPRDAGARAATLIDLVHLPLSVLNKYPYELSSGQRQRVAIARALVLGPTVLVADEPTAGIDATVRDAVIDVLSQLRDADFTAVIVSHDLPVLQRISDRCLVLNSGRVIGLGPLAELLADPPHPYIASLAEVTGRGRRREAGERGGATRRAANRTDGSASR